MILRISPDGMRSWAYSVSLATSWAKVPAARAICPPLPGFSSMLWTSVPRGMPLSGQGVADQDVGVLAGQHGAAHFQPVGGQDVALLAVRVDQQGDAGGAVGVVLDGGDPGRHVRLVALEVDDAVALLVPAADVAGGDAARCWTGRRCGCA